MPTLLIVHDDELLVAQLRECMDGWTVGSTEHGDTAVAEADAFDVVVVDVGRAPIDGWFVLANLGSLEVRPQLVVVGSSKTELRALRLGALAVVQDVQQVGDVLLADLAVA